MVTITEELDVAAASRLLRDRGIRYALVTDHAGCELLGVLTERDIVVTVVAREADPRMLRVGDVMTRLATPVPVERIVSALPELSRNGRLNVVDTQSQDLAGLLASLDIPRRVIERLGEISAQTYGKRLGH